MIPEFEVARCVAVPYCYMAAPAMEDETDLRDPDLLEELVYSDGDSGGSESEDSEAEPERTVADHGYNLRPKRMVAGTVAAPERHKVDAIAPGEGVVADHRRVGGRDERISRRSSGVNTESENSGEGWKCATRECAGGPSDGSGYSSRDSVAFGSYDELLGLRCGRPEATREFSHRASPLYEVMSRGELEAQSAHLISQFRRSMQERARMLSPPTNELAIRQDSSRLSDAGRKEKNRREPSASNLLGQVPVKPGRGLFSDRSYIILQWPNPHFVLLLDLAYT